MKFQGRYAIISSVIARKPYIFNSLPAKIQVVLRSSISDSLVIEMRVIFPAPGNTNLALYFRLCKDPAAGLVGPHNARSTPTCATNRRIAMSATSM